MSVLACNRGNCQNIMCDKYSHEYGYICWECFNELVASGPKTDIQDFMNSEKVLNTLDVQEESLARYNRVFKNNE